MKHFWIVTGSWEWNHHHHDIEPNIVRMCENLTGASLILISYPKCMYCGIDYSPQLNGERCKKDADTLTKDDGRPL